MGEISNKTLAILVVIAILISVVGLFMKTGVIKTGQASAEETGLIQAKVESDIQIAISGGMDLRTDGDLVAGGPALDSSTLGTPKYIYVAAVGQSRLDISYRSNCNLFLNAADGEVKDFGECATGGQADDSYYRMQIISASGENFNDIEDGTPYTIGSDCNSLGGVWSYNSYGNINVDGPGSEDGLAVDCDGTNNEGFKVSIEVAAPPNEAPGDKSSTIYFLGEACAAC
jgi:hypothetical protein